MNYLSDSEQNDLNDFADIADNLLGGKYSKPIGLLHVKLEFSVDRDKDICAWFINQIKLLKYKERKIKEKTNGNQSILTVGQQED